MDTKITAQKVTSTYEEILFHNVALYTQDRFISNTKKNVSLITVIFLHLKQAGFVVINCSGDADSAVVVTALDAEKKPTRKLSLLLLMTQILQ